MGIKAKYVIWDWNGTLLEDREICILVQNEMLKKRGLRLIDSAEYYYSVFTFPIINYYKNLGYDLEKEDFTEIADIYVKRYEEMLPECRLYNGAKDIMAYIKERGIGQAIVSASSVRSLALQTNGRGLEGLVDAIVGISDELAGSKKDIALSYIKSLDIDPSDIIFVGDSLHDNEVAEYCGCRSVLIANGHQSRACLEKSGSIVFDNLAEFRKNLQL